MNIKKLFFDRINYFISLPAILWEVIFLWVPFLIVIIASIYSRSFGFTSRFYLELFTGAHVRIILRSLLLAVFNAFFCLLAAYPLCYFIAFRGGRWKNILVFLFTLPFWVNFLVHVYSWFFILDRNGLLNKLLLSLHIIKEPLHLMNTIIAVALVMFYAYLPFMILPIYIIFEKFDMRLIEASMDLGANKRETFWRVTFPLTLSGAKLGFFLVLGMSFGEYIIPQLLNGGRFFFVGTLISEYFLVSRDFSVGSAFTCLNALIVIVVMAICLLLFRLIKRGVK